MGKKHNKFKKRHATKQSFSEPQIAYPTETTSMPETAQPSPKVIVASKQQEDEIAILNEKYTFVRHDVRKLIIVLCILTILFIAIYFINTRTTLLADFGNWIYRVGNFSI